MIVRLKYSKTTEGRFMSHLDLLRTMERVFRRAKLPLAFSQGFNPHPKISFGSALAVGVTSEGEYVDVELTRELPLEQIKESLDVAMPSAVKILEIKKIDTRKQGLMAVINVARYQVEIPMLGSISQAEFDEALTKVWQVPTYQVERRGKRGIRQVDIKQGIFILVGQVIDDKIKVEMELQTGSKGNVKPEEVVKMIKELCEIPLGENMRIHREGLYIKKDGKLITPMAI